MLNKLFKSVGKNLKRLILKYENVAHDLETKAINQRTWTYLYPLLVKQLEVQTTLQFSGNKTEHIF